MGMTSRGAVTRRVGLVVAALLAAGGASPACRRRPLEARQIDAGGDAFDTRPADVGRDGVLDVSGPAICPAGVAPLDVCGCGCCGAAARRDCYYPSLGESRDTVPNPMPTPQQCSTTGCSEGDRYLCCADPGAQPAPGAIYCAQNSSLEDMPRFRITRRDGTVCTTVEIGGPAQPFPISGPGATPAITTTSTSRCSSTAVPGSPTPYGSTSTTSASRRGVRPTSVRPALAPARSIRLTADVTCAPPPPACGGPGIDVAAVTAALGDADVQQALARSLGAATIPLYGQDARPSDGQAFQITRADGGGFLIGAPCSAGATPSSCVEIRGGLSRLQALLVAFDQQQLADASCAPLRP
jgi:hypothetical protein